MSKQLYTYKFALSPTKLQTILLNKHCGAVRYLYNYFLKQRHNNYLSNRELDKDKKKHINYYDQARELTLLKQQIETGWLKEINSQTLQFALKTLDGAYNDFFKGKSSLPVYHSRLHSNSFRIPQSVEVREGKLLIPKLKEVLKGKDGEVDTHKGITLIQHREIEGKIKFATITYNPDNTYHVSITVERNIAKLPKTNKVVGIDIGIKDTFTTSEGQKTGNPRAIKKYQKKLHFFQRKFATLVSLSPKEPVIRDGKQVRTKTGRPKFKAKQSKNTKKLATRVAKYHTKIKNRRKDHIQKATTHLIRKYDTIVIEDLNTKGMVKNHKLAKSVHDASFGEVRRQLEYKSRWYGRELIKIDRWFPSSKTCSQCAYLNSSLKLEDREWYCTSCGSYHDRDINAAKNILAQGISMPVGTQA